MDALNPSPQVLSKLGSLIIHYQEWRHTNHPLDLEAIKSLEDDLEVCDWLDEMEKLALLPVKR